MDDGYSSTVGSGGFSPTEDSSSYYTQPDTSFDSKIGYTDPAAGQGDTNSFNGLPTEDMSYMDQAFADNAMGDNNMYRNPDFQQRDVDYDSMDWLQGNWNRYGKYLKFGLGMLGRVNPAIGTGMALYNMFSNPRNSVAGSAGGALGGALAGAVNPALAGVGSMWGSEAAQGAARGLEGSYGQAIGPKGGSSTNQMGFGEAGGRLGDIWNRYGTAKDYGSQADSLNSLYGQNSPYAQQLQQSLARKAAQAGRRSQFGTRNVELQARLADLASRNAPQLQNLTKAKGDERTKMYIDMAALGKGLYDMY